MSEIVTLAALFMRLVYEGQLESDLSETSPWTVCASDALENQQACESALHLESTMARDRHHCTYTCCKSLSRQLTQIQVLWHYGQRCKTAQVSDYGSAEIAHMKYQASS